MPARWTIFCAMIDNYGDIGVCWRLARQLVHEKGINVDLWVDDWPAAVRFLQAQIVDHILSVEDVRLSVAGVNIFHWPALWSENADVNVRIGNSDCVIEAFGCELPEAVKQVLAIRTTPLVWINLEYLSAEPWVGGCHGLPSPQNLSSLLHKYFFFPGFVQETGGLLRETDLLLQHQAWQANLAAEREQLLASLGLGSAATQRPDLLISVFCYESPSMFSWLEALTEGKDRVLCLVPEGSALTSMSTFLQTDSPAAGRISQRGSLTIAVIPFRSQQDYDHILSVCDFNVVRGEDSFVRAQWAARPFIWNIYPQEDGVHIKKLEAFADCYLTGLHPDAGKAWLRFAMGWNLGEDCRELWHYLRPQLPDLLLHTREWQKKLAVMPDLATNLVKFETFTKLSVRP